MGVPIRNYDMEKVDKAIDEFYKPSASPSGSTALYAVKLEWETGRKEFIEVDAENKEAAVRKALKQSFGSTNIQVACVR